MAWANSRHNSRRKGSGWQEQAEHRAILKAEPRCRNCGARATVVDHIIPGAEGGPDTRANKQPLCKPCHDAKTKAEAARGRQRLSRKRPKPKHPGVR